MIREEPGQFGDSVRDTLRLNRIPRVAAADWRTGEAHLWSLLGGIRPRWAREVACLVIEWATGSAAHPQTTTAISEVAAAIPIRNTHAASSLAIARLCSSAGLFEAALRFAQIGYSSLELVANTTIRARLKAVLAALYRQDITAATAHWQHLEHIAVPSGGTGALFRAVASYMATLVGEGVNSIDSGWLNQRSSAQILLVGPCNGKVAAKTGQWVAQIVRIAGTTDFYDVAPADHTILYANGETDAWLSAHDEEEIEARFSEASWFVTKQAHSSLDLKNLRKLDPSLSLLHLNGHPNMVPLMCIDLLANPGVTVHVVGANFYASQEMALSSTPDTTSEFDLCGALASHNPFENRALVANLVDAGRVDGDGSFAHALDLKDMEYASVLDQNYGVRRR